MDYSKINDILDKYYAGETSSSEEELLCAYFMQDGIDDKFAAEKQMFLSFQEMKQHKALPSIENDIKDVLNEKWRHEQTGKVRKLIIWTSAISACIAIVFTMFLLNVSQSNPNVIELADEQEAYKTAKNALVLISEKMNSQTKAFESLRKMNEGFSALDKLSALSAKLEEVN